MNIQYISDLHLEFQPQIINKFIILSETDILILAGDIHTSPKGVERFFKVLRQKTNIPIIYVLGNHEYYKHDILTIIKEYKQVSEEHKITLLDGDRIEINNTIFIGGTLYTEIPPDKEIIVTKGLNDFQYVKYAGQKLTTLTWNSRFFSYKEKILEHLLFAQKSNKKSVVITHMAPLWELQGIRYKDSYISSAFYANLSKLITDYPPNIWIYGHTHEIIDQEFNNCWFITNQLGYPYETWLPLSTKSIEI